MTEKQLNLLKRLEEKADVTYYIKEVDWKIELTYDAKDKVYREKETKFFPMPIEHLIEIAKGKDKDIELS